jgi:phenylpyruvate tautomerase PptA (4-oxalocrotonate tautomerase family)
MPTIEATLIEGYDENVKSRLAKAFIRAVQSVMAAPADAIIIILREAPVGNYWRSGGPPTPGPALPAASDIVRSFTEALETGGGYEDYSVEGFCIPPVDGHKLYEQFDEALVDGGSIVFGYGKIANSSARFIDRFSVSNGRITDMISWIDRAAG